MLPKRLWKWLTTYKGLGWPANPVWRDPSLHLVPGKARKKLFQRVRWRITPPWLFGLFVFGAALFCISAFGRQLGFYGSGPSFIPSITIMVFYFSVVTSMSIVARRRRKRVIFQELTRRSCWECGYSLLHLPGLRCPECGTPFDPAEYEWIERAMNGDGEPEEP